MTQYNMPEDVLDYIKELEKRIGKLEKLVRVGNTSIDKGALEVREEGTPRVKVGLLDDGTYGLSVYNDAGLALPLSQLAFGLGAKSLPDLRGPIPVNTWVGEDGPEFEFDIVSGRVIVIVSASLHVYDPEGLGVSPTRLAMSYRIYHQSPFYDAVTPNSNRALAVDLAPGAGMQGTTLQSSFVYAHEGLEPGRYVIGARYGTLSTGGSPATGEVSHRSLIVIPY